MEVCEGRRTLTTIRTNQRLLNAHLWALHALFPQAQDVEIRRGGKRACIRSKIRGRRQAFATYEIGRGILLHRVEDC
jgi:hypothetical protein